MRCPNANTGRGRGAAGSRSSQSGGSHGGPSREGRGGRRGKRGGRGRGRSITWVWARKKTLAEGERNPNPLKRVLGKQTKMLPNAKDDEQNASQAKPNPKNGYTN
ncbi:hypothetical protein C8F04DRAFT_1192711 [Mycena alexandri]|uniref:Uncharacterized protein n=1 Tax=Mycena alexandri TaxID=1745969 RepID=A0AAD6WUR0_9AGAR|nr:hypothetical protein C8F04DRAFT_1192711 [Mycena alexandri]